MEGDIWWLGYRSGGVRGVEKSTLTEKDRSNNYM